MTIPKTGQSPWPARCAYIAASIFIAASGTTNVIYGWSKGDSLATSLVWAGVAGAVAIVFALSWPALIRSVDAKRWSAALIALVAMLLSGAYSVTAALGSAAGGRANAAATETATTDARSKAQAAYDTRQGRTGHPGRCQAGSRDPGADRHHQGRAGKAAGRTIGGRSRGSPQRRPSASPSATAAPWSMARWRSPAPSWTANSLGRASVSAWEPRSLPCWRMPAGPSNASRSSVRRPGRQWTRRPGTWPASSRPGLRTPMRRHLRDTLAPSVLRSARTG